METPIDLLTKSSYFSGLSKEQLEKVGAVATIKSFKRNEQILKEADKGETLFLLITGRVDIYVSLVGQNKREVIATLGDGEIIGEMMLLGKNRRTADVMAKDDVSAFSWDVKDLHKLFETDLQIGFLVMRNIAKQMAERLISTNQVLRNALTVSTTPVF